MALKVYDKKLGFVYRYVLGSLSRTLWRIIQRPEDKGAFLHKLHEVGFIEHLLPACGEIDTQFAQLHGVLFSYAISIGHSFTIDNGVIHTVFSLDAG